MKRVNSVYGLVLSAKLVNVSEHSLAIIGPLNVSVDRLLCS